MGYRIGTVKQTEPGGYAQVVTERKTACGECRHIKLVCYGCLLSPKIVGRVANPINAQAGDRVKVSLATGKVLTAAGIFYLMPTLTMMAGLFAGAYVSGAAGSSETLSAIFGAGIGLILGLLLAVAIGRTGIIVKSLQPQITGIVK